MAGEAIGRIDSMTTVLTTYKHIVHTPDIVGGKPRIAGHRITVQHVVIWHEHMGYSIEEIASLYDLTLAEVHSALAYYFDHKDEVDRSITESETFVAELRQKTPSLLAQRLYERTD
jgi:uncharacterized protein (DUF433 family)